MTWSSSTNQKTMSLGPKERFEYAWKHFDFIADQRIRTFNFYIILLAASLGATLTIYEKMPKLPALLACAAWHIFTSGIFFVFDLRSYKLLEGPRKALMWFESQSDWEGPKLVTDDYNRKERKILTFTVAARLTFIAQFITGIGILICAFARS